MAPFSIRQIDQIDLNFLILTSLQSSIYKRLSCDIVGYKNPLNHLLHIMIINISNQNLQNNLQIKGIQTYHHRWNDQISLQADFTLLKPWGKHWKIEIISINFRFIDQIFNKLIWLSLKQRNHNLSSRSHIIILKFLINNCRHINSIKNNKGKRNSLP